MSHRVSRHLRLAVAEYDAAIRRFIPEYETMLATAALEVLAARPGRILDLGAGTGALAGAVLERAAAAPARTPDVAAGAPAGLVVELLDIDPAMLDQARARLRPYGHRARFTLGSFEDALPSCDAVMASLSLHHVPTLEAKTALFRRIGDALPVGGVFVNADVTMPAHEPARSAAFAGWADHLVSCGIARAEAFDHFAAWADEDTYFPVDAELSALAEAGFDARCVWQEGVSTVVSARRRG